MTKTEKQVIGNIGENIACEYLRRRGFVIVDRNYRKKWGELDIVASKNGIFHFVEVKTKAITRESNGYNPEENVRLWKKERMGRAIRTYLLDKNVSDETEFEIDVIAIRLDFSTKKAKIRFIQNILLA